IVPAAVGLQVHRRELPDLARVGDARFEPARLLFGAHSSQYFMRIIPDSTIAFSNSGVTSRKRPTCSIEQNSITRSTPARLYQLRSKITISPPAGKCRMYR